MPNTLLDMQDITNSPWANGDISRDAYINMVKTQDIVDDRNEKEPSKLKIPQVQNASIQADPEGSQASIEHLPPAANTLEMQ